MSQNPKAYRVGLFILSAVAIVIARGGLGQIAEMHHLPIVRQAIMVCV